MNTIILNNESIARTLASEYSDRVEISRLELQRGETGMMRKMSDFLNNQHRSGQRFGFEIVHEGSETTFNIFTTQYKYEASASRFVDTHEEVGSFSVPESDFPEIEADKVMTAFEFELSDDYWIPLSTYSDSTSRDPLSKVISEMDSREDIDYIFQVLADPVGDRIWSHRYPFTWMIKGYFSDLWEQMKYEYGTIKSERSWIGKMFKSSISMARLGKFALYDYPLKWMNGMSHKAFEDTFIESGQLRDNIDTKIKQRGFATKIRLVAVADSEEDLDKKVPDVVDTIMDISRCEYTDDNNSITTVQQLQADQNKGVETIAAQTYGRHSSKAPTGQLRETHSFKSFKNKRTKPMILTANELAVYMHHINNPTHDSIKFN